jgi:Protein of unknown function (DUF3275)
MSVFHSQNTHTKESIMIYLDGTIAVKIVNGKKGSFAVGELITAIGSFAVKSKLLDQYEEGLYKGRFAVTSIKIAHSPWKDGVFTDVRAEVSDIMLTEQDIGPAPSPAPAPDHIDPIDEVSLPTKAIEPLPESPAAEVTTTPVTVENEFSVQVQAGAPIRLDPTADRSLFRQQRDYLKSVGYKFDAQHQVWVK